MFGLLIALIIFAFVASILWVVLGMLPLPPNLRLIIELLFCLLCLLALVGYGPSLGLPHSRFG